MTHGQTLRRYSGPCNATGATPGRVGNESPGAPIYEGELRMSTTIAVVKAAVALSPDDGNDPLSVAEARSLTDRIGATANDLCILLLEAQQRKAWKTLGYANWQQYVEVEFRKTRQWAHLLMNQARVIEQIRDAAGTSTTVDITERVARELKPHMPKVTAKIRELIDAGQEPADVVRTVVRAARSQLVGQPQPVASREVHEAAVKVQTDDARNDLAEATAFFNVDEIIVELEHAHRQISQLEAELASLTKGDLAEEVRSLHTRYAQLEGRLKQVTTTSAAAQKQARYAQDLLKKVRATLGVEKNAQILPAIKSRLA
jgi:predicted  nucleic acid-binding Zn-ribbon protein